jgi:hypothetical protein
VPPEEEAPKDEGLERLTTKIIRIGTEFEDEPEPVTEVVKIERKNSVAEESKVAEESINLEQ